MRGLQLLEQRPERLVGLDVEHVEQLTRHGLHAVDALVEVLTLRDDSGVPRDEPGVVPGPARLCTRFGAGVQDAVCAG